MENELIKDRELAMDNFEEKTYGIVSSGEPKNYSPEMAEEMAFVYYNSANVIEDERVEKELVDDYLLNENLYEEEDETEIPRKKRKNREKYKITDKKLGESLVEEIKKLAVLQDEYENLCNSNKDLSESDFNALELKKVSLKNRINKLSIDKVQPLIKSFKKKSDSYKFDHKGFVDSFWDTANEIFPKSYEYEHQDEWKNITEISKNGEIYSKGSLYRKEDETRYQDILRGIKSALPKDYFSGNLNAQEVLDFFSKIIDKTKRGWNDDLDDPEWRKADKFQLLIIELKKEVSSLSMETLIDKLSHYQDKYTKNMTEYTLTSNDLKEDIENEEIRKKYDLLKYITPDYLEVVNTIKKELEDRKENPVKCREVIKNKFNKVLIPAKEFAPIDNVSRRKAQDLSEVRNGQHKKREDAKAKAKLQKFIKKYTQTDSVFPSL